MTDATASPRRPLRASGIHLPDITQRCWFDRKNSKDVEPMVVVAAVLAGRSSLGSEQGAADSAKGTADACDAGPARLADQGIGAVLRRTAPDSGFGGDVGAMGHRPGGAMVADVELWCAGCDRVVEADLLGLAAGDEAGPCEDCGCSLYVVDVDDLVDGDEGVEVAG
jgi:hypothetical protein